MSSVGSNKGPESSVTGTNSSAADKPAPKETNIEGPISNDEKESTLTSTDLEQDPSARKRKRVPIGSDSEVPSTPSAIGRESPIDSNTLLKRKKSENAKDDTALDDSLDEDETHQSSTSASLNVNSLQANVDILEELYTLRASLANVVAKLPKQPSSSKSPIHSNQAWGSLVPSNSQQPTVVLKGATFTVGRNSKCSMCIGDNHIASVLFKIHYSNGVALFESTSNNGTTYINGKVHKRNSKIVLKDSDEITINGSKVYSYIFREASATTNTTTPTPTPTPTTTTPLKVDSLVTPMTVDGIATPTTTTTTTTTAPGSSSAVSSPIAAAVRNRRRGPHFMVSSPTFVPPPLSDDPVSLPHSSFLASLFPVPNNNNENTTPAATAESLRKKYKEEFSKNIISFKDITTSFEKFPYYLQDNVKHQLMSSAYIYLKRPDYVKYLNESPLTRRLMLCGPSGTELYQESLVKALAFEFKANLLIVEASTLDVEKDKEKEKEKAEEYSSDELDDWDPEIRPRKERKMGLGRLMRGGNRSNNKVVITVAEGSERRSYDASEPKEEDKSELEIIWETLIDTVSDTTQPHILLIKDIESLFFTPSFKQLNLKKIFNKITAPLFIIGSSVSAEMRRENTMQQSGLLVSKGTASHTTALLDIAFLDHFARLGERAKDRDKVTKISNKLFPNKINIVVPTESNELNEWTSKINQDVEQIKMEKNAKNLKKIMEKNLVQMEEVSTPLFSKTVYSPENIEKIAGFAISHHIMHTEDSNLQDGNMVVPLKSLEHGIKILKSVESGGKPKSLKDIEPENDFERRLLSEVIPPNEIDIKFEDIGALDDVKQTLKELVMLPLRRPELFARGNLTKPTKGILLFGPPGTGKTMLAKAVATQCGANFINISMSSIASKWFGECEKFVKAIFTLASKISPTVIFVDEVDSMLGKRDKHGEHETMRKIKNEFMSNWDGLKSRDGERVIVLAASNRPFDLDDAVLRRLPRRVLVDLPDKENRAKILKVILGKEDLEPDFDFNELAQMTDGYSGSDMKNLSIAAAYKPIREVLQKEKEEGISETEVKTDIKLRALTMKDFEKSLEEVSASVSEDAVSIAELRKWNDLYGEKGSRKKQLLPYFL